MKERHKKITSQKTANLVNSIHFGVCRLSCERRKFSSRIIYASTLIIRHQIWFVQSEFDFHHDSELTDDLTPTRHLSSHSPFIDESWWARKDSLFFVSFRLHEHEHSIWNSLIELLEKKRRKQSRESKSWSWTSFRRRQMCDVMKFGEMRMEQKQKDSEKPMKKLSGGKSVCFFFCFVFHTR